MQSTRRFNAPAVRDALLRRGGPTECGLVRYAYRPFDTRWLYWEADTKLLDEKRAEYMPHVSEGNLWLSVVPRLRTEATEPQTAVTTHLASLHLIEWSASMFPAWLNENALGTGGEGARRPNLSPAARRYLERLDLTVEDLFHHVLAVLHDPAYREANAGALRMAWPRIPLPGWAELSASAPSGGGALVGALREAPDPPGGEGGSRTAPTSEQAAEAAQTLTASTARGRELAALLDPETPVSGVTTGELRPEIAAIAVPATTHGRNMTGDDFALTAGWGHFGTGQAVMPGQGRTVERAYTQAECVALGDAIDTLGDTTFDIHLNDRAYWRNVPAAVWRYKLGGYQVLKKWLSYRERPILDRPLRPEEVQHFADTARRASGILTRIGVSARGESPDVG